MSHSQLDPVRSDAWNDSATDRTLTGMGDEMRTMLSVLADEDCREILEETGDGPRSANELSAACDIPLSTTYRKVELLTDAGLLEERLRLCRGGQHTNEYVRRFEEIEISIYADADLTLRVTQSDHADRRLVAPGQSGW